MLIAVNYHYIRESFDAPYPSIFGVTPAQFASQLETLGHAGEFVSAAQIRDAIAGAKPLPERAIAITFDDGLQEQYQLAWPILQRLGIPAIFFTNTAGVAERRVLAVHKTHIVRAHIAPAELLASIAHQFQPEFEEKARAQYSYDTPEVGRLKYLLNFVLPPDERERLIERHFAQLFPGAEADLSEKLYLTPAQMRELSAHGCLGSHSHDHLPLGLLPLAAAEQQIAQSIHWIETWTGHRPFALTYPYGSREASARPVGDCAARLGIRFGFTIECAANQHLQPALWLARCDCNEVPGGKAQQWTAENWFADIPTASWFQETNAN